MFQLPDLCNKIALFLQSLLLTASFCKIKQIAEKFDLKNLKNACHEYAAENLDLMIEEGAFDKLDMECFAFVISSICGSHPSLEDSKLATIIRWIKADIKSRQEQLMKLTRHVDLKKITPSYGRYVVENEELLFESTECLRSFYLAGMDRLDVKPANTNVSLSPSANTIIVFDLSSDHLMAYIPESNTWTTMHALHQDMSNVDVKYISVILKGFLYVLMDNKKVFRINLLSMDAVWTERKSSMREHGEYLRAAVHGNFIYVVGERSMERYCHIDDKWEMIDLGDITGSETTLVSYSGWIYCFGGCDKSNDSSNEVYKYSHAMSCWSPVVSMQIKRQTPAVAVYKGKIYVSGGINDMSDDGLSDVECYSPKSDSWMTPGPMVEARDDFGLCAASGKLFAVGHREESCTIEMYDFDTKKWSIVPAVEQDKEMFILAQATVAIFIPESS